ncbi:hypothetical protein GCM10027168_61510 [Streptomyces capparidis]
MTPPSSPPPPERRRHRWLPDPATRTGALFYSLVGGVLIWLGLDFLPAHIEIGWR